MTWRVIWSKEGVIWLSNIAPKTHQIAVGSCFSGRCFGTRAADRGTQWWKTGSVHLTTACVNKESINYGAALNVFRTVLFGSQSFCCRYYSGHNYPAQFGGLPVFRQNRKLSDYFLGNVLVVSAGSNNLWRRTLKCGPWSTAIFIKSVRGSWYKIQRQIQSKGNWYKLRRFSWKV